MDSVTCGACAGRGGIWNGVDDAYECDVCRGWGHFPNPERPSTNPDDEHVEVEWHVRDDRALDREDSLWYTDSNTTSNPVVSLTDGEMWVHVSVDGEMRVQVMRHEGDGRIEYSDVLRSADDFKRLGFKNDSDVYEGNEDGVLDWENNSWYAIYLDTPKGYVATDVVEHTLSDALAQAFKQFALKR